MTPPTDTLAMGHALVLDHAERLAGQGRLAEAIGVLRPSLKDPRPPWQILVRISQLLCAVGGAAEAVAIVEAPATAPGADIRLITAHGAALQAAGRLERAIGAFERGVARLPASGGAEQNLAMALCEGHWFAESEASTDRALAKGSDTPDLWLTRARALQGLGRLDEAERAFREALRRGAGAEAHAELAQLIWTRSEDAALALAGLDAALAGRPGDGALVRAKANVLIALGDRAGAYQTYARALARGDADQMLHADAAVVAGWLDPAAALAHAQRAVALFPQRPEAHFAHCQACLAAGRPEPALATAEALRRAWPQDQFVLALIALAWRLMDDPRYRALYDYARLVRAQPLATPAGWSSLEGYLADLRTSLEGLHRLRGHPIGQSLRHGVQTPQCLTRVADPVVAAFFEAIDPPIRAYLEAVRDEGEALGRAWAPGEGYRLERAWSVLLRPGGFHVDHIHPRGWIASACHIALPGAVEAEPQGWLKFGEPGVATTPRLPAEHRVKPRPGWLVLFPAYMWHGTAPFGGPESRLSAAMDIAPG
jgi:tetratricopeptide (TPR) repeat protein